jgi:hypothetical protein
MQLDIYCIPFWNKFLKTKVLHQRKNLSKKTDQGMILGTSAFVYRVSYGVRYAFDK